MVPPLRLALLLGLTALLATVPGCTCAGTAGEQDVDAGDAGGPAMAPDGGADEDAGAPADGGAGDPMQEALLTCDVSRVSEAQLLAYVRTRLSDVRSSRQATWAALTQRDGGSVGAVTWDPSHDSATLASTDPERNVAFLLSNATGNAGGTSLQAPLGMAGETPTARYAAYGGNVLHALQKAPQASLQALAENTMTWLTRRADLKTAPFKVVLAHLPNQYWFPYEPTTKAWFQQTYPQVSLNAGRCESAQLATCLVGADLLVIGMDTGTDNPAAGPFDLAATLAAVDAAQARGVPVLYLHYYRDPNELGTQLLRRLRMTGASNYWSLEKVDAIDPGALGPSTADLDQLGTLAETVAAHGLSVADYQSCLGTATNLGDCTQPAFLANLVNGAASLRTIVNAFDQAAQVLCPSDRHLVEAFVLLADLYRAGDATTAALHYPVLPATQAQAFAHAVFADAVAPLVRPAAPAQADLGAFTCPMARRTSGACTGAGYDVAAVPRVDKVLTAQPLAATEWTSTGTYLLPGRPVTLRRTDGVAGVTVSAVVNFQRAGSTHAFTDYTRPQYLRSTAVVLAPGASVTLTSPWGGPLYLQTSGSASAVAPVTVEAKQVAEHATLLDVGNVADVQAFPARLAANPLPHVDLRAPGFEAHLRRDELEGTVTTLYGGSTAAMLTDISANFIDQVYGLAGFKLPGRTLVQTASADRQAICAHLGWDCTNEALHARNTIQHANFDGVATCGSGCSGNPFDADWAFTPLGWGESHELGHNLQLKPLNVGWYGTGTADDWSRYSSRAGENSNNIFPYHTLWNAERRVRNNVARLTDGHMNQKDLFAVIQSDLAGLTRSVGGVTRRVIFDAGCQRLGDYDPASHDNRGAAIWSSSAYAANNGLRMSFYLQLPLMTHGRAMSDGSVLTDGFDLFPLLYAQARLFKAAAASQATWDAQKSALGFASFPYTGAATYGGGNVGDVPGNDFLVVALSFITGQDYRPYFVSRGVTFSTLAGAQVAAHVTSGRVTSVVDTSMFALDAALPQANLTQGLQRVALDGVATWPTDGWHPSQCP